VVSGATSGPSPPAELQYVFFRQLRVVGSTMGTRDELERLARLCADAGIRPTIDRVLPLAELRDGLAAMAAGRLFGKIVALP
jgi:D-arabinose 1-dehydrogenase-like Zn-dependent alcohol dehydrogenase